MLKALARLLASEGLTTEQFNEPASFLAYAESHAVELVVLDVRMPGMSGFTVQDTLGQMHPQASVIMITAEDDPAHRTAAMAAGASGFFLKPLDAATFVAAVRAALLEPLNPGSR